MSPTVIRSPDEAVLLQVTGAERNLDRRWLERLRERRRGEPDGAAGLDDQRRGAEGVSEARI